MRVFITRPIPESGLARLREAGHEPIVSPQDAPISREALIQGLSSCDAAITMLTEKVDAALMDACPSVKVYANFAVGFNNMDVEAARARGVVLTNTPDVLTDATADLAWTLMLAAARRAGEAERALRRGEWDGWGPLQYLGQSLVGKTLGIVGPGRIGRATARRAAGFDMKVLYQSRSENPTIESECGAKRVSLDELLRESDFVSLHCPLTPETQGMIGADQLAIMKKTAILVNTARGPVVDEAALVDALKSGQIAGAGLDVFEKEPTIHPGLFECENAVLLPHIGSATTETRSVMAELCARNIIAHFAGEKLPTPIT